MENNRWYANNRSKYLERNSFEINRLICFCYKENKWNFWCIFIGWGIVKRLEHKNFGQTIKWERSHLWCHQPWWFWIITWLIQLNPKLNVQNVYSKEWSLFNKHCHSEFKVYWTIKFHSFWITLLALLLSKEFNMHKPFFNGWFIYLKFKTDWIKLFITIYNFIRTKQISL